MRCEKHGCDSECTCSHYCHEHHQKICVEFYEKTMAQMFDEWYEPRENELMDMEPEDIALRAWNAGYVSAQQSVQSDGACTCPKPSWVHDDGFTFYCSVCGKSPRR